MRERIKTLARNNIILILLLYKRVKHAKEFTGKYY